MGICKLPSCTFLVGEFVSFAGLLRSDIALNRGLSVLVLLSVLVRYIIDVICAAFIERVHGR